MIKLTPDVKGRENPAWLPLIHKGLEGPMQKQYLYYHGAVGSMSYLQGTSHPDTSRPTHQCAWFCNDPKLYHERAIRKIAKYLSVTSDRGSWNKAVADNLENVMLQTGFTIMYASCPVLWQSKLQIEIALSIAEAE
eukprot:2016461-Ditylum_brightwellii.AAC.1